MSRFAEIAPLTLFILAQGRILKTLAYRLRGTVGLGIIRAEPAKPQEQNPADRSNSW